MSRGATRGEDLGGSEVEELAARWLEGRGRDPIRSKVPTCRVSQVSVAGIVMMVLVQYFVFGYLDPYKKLGLRGQL